MNEFTAWHYDTLGAKTAEALTGNNFGATYCISVQEAVEQILDMIPTDAAVGVGGSFTVKELGLLDRLATRGNTILDHSAPDLDAEERTEVRRRQLTCDVFLTGTNAVTADGKIVNVDGTGNRVAAMIFGPKKVIIVVGVNKIVKDVAEAEKRIRLLAAPMNNKRLNLPNPCVKTGECMDCKGASRICNVTTILNKRPTLSDIHVFIVREELGF